MSEPPCQPPQESTTWLRAGGEVDSCSVCLRLFGDGLDPDAVTAALGTAPTTACRKGDVTRLKVTTRIETCGNWLLAIDHRAGTTLETVISELLDRVTGDLAVWADLTTRFQTDLFCGLTMEQWNRGLCLSPQILKRVSDRSLELMLDIYYVAEDELD